MADGGLASWAVSGDAAGTSSTDIGGVGSVGRSGRAVRMRDAGDGGGLRSVALTPAASPLTFRRRLGAPVVDGAAPTGGWVGGPRLTRLKMPDTHRHGPRRRGDRIGKGDRHLSPETDVLGDMYGARHKQSTWKTPPPAAGSSFVPGTVRVTYESTRAGGVVFGYRARGGVRCALRSWG